MAEQKNLPAQPSLIGKKVYLRPMTAEDAANYHLWFIQSEPQSMSVRPMPFYTFEEASDRFKKAEKNDKMQRFTIVTKESKRPVGAITFFDFNYLNRSAELGILIDPDERENGLAKDAMIVLIKYLFNYRDLNKVYCETASYNSGAIALLESLDFKRDGVLRKHHYFNGDYFDKYVYSLLRFEIDF